jgi:hypothetical protein
LWEIKYRNAVKKLSVLHLFLTAVKYPIFHFTNHHFATGYSPWPLHIEKTSEKHIHPILKKKKNTHKGEQSTPHLSNEFYEAARYDTLTKLNSSL